MLRGGQVKEIYELKGQGYSAREIARELGLARNTVLRYLKGPEAMRAQPRPLRGSKLDHRGEVAAGAHVDASGVQVYPGQLRRQALSSSPAFLRLRLFTPPARVHYPAPHCCVGAPPEGATESAQSIERERPGQGVTNDAVVRLPDHALHRASCTNAESVLVRRHATPNLTPTHGHAC